MGVYISAAEACGHDLEPAHWIVMEEISALLANEPPMYLPQVLIEQSFIIANAKSCQDMSLSRVAAVELLCQSEHLALTLSEALNSASTHAFFSESCIAWQAALNSIVVACRRERRSTRLLSEDGRLRRGRGKHLSPGQLPAKYLCAAIIAECWAYFHNGKLPSSTNRFACKAAQLLFNALPGRDQKSWGKTENRWRRYFDSVNNESLLGIRAQVRRLLTLHSRDLVH